jgi:hypothetical protein
MRFELVTLVLCDTVLSRLSYSLKIFFFFFFYFFYTKEEERKLHIHIREEKRKFELITPFHEM